MYLVETLSILHYILVFIGIGVLFTGFWAGVVSLQEREESAAWKILLITPCATILILLLAVFSFPYADILRIVTIFLVLLMGIILILPLEKAKQTQPNEAKPKIVDERDIMFARASLKIDSEEFKDYYTRKPEFLDTDNSFRVLPGLLNENAGKYINFPFSSANANFQTVDFLRKGISGIVNKNQKPVDKTQITRYIKEWTKSLGTHSVGVAKLEPHHIYSHTGRGKNYGQKIELDHQFAIAFTVEMDFFMTQMSPEAPIVMESSKQYLASAQIAVQIATFIRSLGYEARAHIDGNYQVICPLVAEDAGLGQIGRMGLLMTPKLGPRVRIAVVSTNLPLIADKKSKDTSMIEFCNACKKCANTCPVKAIPNDARQNLNGVLRWKINSESCYKYWCKVGTDCGRCLSVCPYSHPDNLLHNIVRNGIKRSFVFSKLALWLDNILYGKIPKPLPVPKWMKEK